MSKAIQRRRGTTTQHASFAGLAGEITVDTDKKTVVVHDGATLGGAALARESHTQAISTITGLQTALDGKAAASHGHAIADTTGLQTALDGKARNLFINGCCRVQQRGSVALSGTLQCGTVDRWLVNGVNVAAGTIMSSAPAATDVQSGAAIFLSGVTLTSGGSVNFVQRIEAMNARRLLGKKASTRMLIYHGVSGSKTATLTIRRANAADDFSATTLVAQATAAVAGGAWTLLKFEGLDLSGDSNVANGVQVGLNLAVDACTAATINLSLAQIEVGEKCADFELRLLPSERDFCDYYCQAYSYAGYDFLGMAAANGPDVADMPLRFRKVMRAAPTVNVGAAAHYQINGGAATAIATTGAIKAGSCCLRLTRTGSFTSGHAYPVNTQDAGRILVFSAEL